MKKILYILICCLAGACTSIDKDNPYEDLLLTLDVSLVYPEEYDEYRRAGVTVTLRDAKSSNSYTTTTDAEGRVSFRVMNGLYNISVRDLPSRTIGFNGSVSNVSMFGKDRSIETGMELIKLGAIVIKEAYFGGCPALPAEGYYVRDKYIILHNNESEIQYLDNICIGMVDPYNSNSSSGNQWLIDGKFRDYASVPDCVWLLAGSGTDFPLGPGQDAVIALNGAVDHTETYPMSVDLNNAAYYVCYDPTAYNQLNSVLYHPTPGNKIQDSHQLKVIKKTGTLTSATFSVSQSSPAFIVFHAPVGFDLSAYLSDDFESVVQRGTLYYTKIPWVENDNWIIDGMEVFVKGASARHKRLPTHIDAEGVDFSAPYLGRTVHRYLDEEASAAAGYEIYVDTNNSANDFYERPSQSLRP